MYRTISRSGRLLTPCAALLLSSLTLTALTGCEEYDAPPEAKIVFPDTGAWGAGDPVVINFSEPIDPATLVINVRPADRTKEGDFEGEPFIAGCTVEKATCDDLTVALSDDRKQLTLNLNPDGLGEPGPPLVIELEPGIKDDAGVDTGISYSFGVQYKLTSYVNTEPVPFDDGLYVLTGQAKVSSFNVILLLYTDMKANEEGEFALAALKANVTDGDKRPTTDPDVLEVDKDPNTGFSIFGKGFIAYKNGRRFLETEKFDVTVPVLGTAKVTLVDVRLIGEFIKDEENGGKDRFEGSLSYADALLYLGQRPTSLKEGSAELIGAFVPEEKHPDGKPELCTNPCGGNTNECTPPANFPGDAICK